MASRLRAKADELNLLASELEAAGTQQETREIRVEGIMKHYTYGNRTIREIGVSRRLSDKGEIAKYDKATEKGQRYCIVTISFPQSILSSQKGNNLSRQERHFNGSI